MWVKEIVFALLKLLWAPLIDTWLPFALTLLLSILVWWLYYRCPQCHESLGRGNPKHCPHCGAWLGDEPEPEEKKKIQHKKKRR